MKEDLRIENMERKIVPIVFAVNDNYCPYLGVTLQSLEEHASDRYIYKLHILVSDISNRHRSMLKTYERENISIDFVNVSEYMRGWNIGTVDHLSPETTYRLLIDKLFPQYDKVLYLDCDIVINRDVAELYNIDIGNNVLGASRAMMFKLMAEYIQNELHIDYTNYFNAGILLINTKEFADKDIGNKGLDMLSKRCYETQDQDVLNVLCKDRVQIIDGRWNVEWACLTGFCRDPIVDEARQGIFDNAKDPYIVHYTSQLKPWNSRISYELSEYFWKYACKSVFYEEIIEKKIFLQMWERYSFPYDRVKPYSNVIIYGYGMVGKSIFSQMRWSGYCNIVAICDKSVTEIDETYSIGGATPPIIKIRDIPKYQYDYIVIALESEETAQNVKKDLMEHGVSEDKIVWECPIRKSV